MLAYRTEIVYSVFAEADARIVINLKADSQRDARDKAISYFVRKFKDVEICAIDTTPEARVVFMTPEPF
jgi:hypothetical protein